MAEDNQLLERAQTHLTAPPKNQPSDLKDLLYSPMLTREKFGRVAPKKKTWILYGLLAAIFYSLFNFVCGQYKGNAIAGKIVSSYVSVVGAIVIQLYQVVAKSFKNRKEQTSTEQSHAMNAYIKGVVRKEKERQSILPNVETNLRDVNTGEPAADYDQINLSQASHQTGNFLQSLQPAKKQQSSLILRQPDGSLIALSSGAGSRKNSAGEHSLTYERQIGSDSAFSGHFSYAGVQEFDIDSDASCDDLLDQHKGNHLASFIPSASLQQAAAEQYQQQQAFKQHMKVRMNALNVLNMEKEVRVSETLATILSYVAGVLIFCANLLMYVAAQIATQANENMAIVVAIANGTIPFGLAGSYFIYKEGLTIWHVIGSLACFAGILVLSLSVLGKKEVDVLVLDIGSTEVGVEGALRKMIIDAFLSMACLGIRNNMAKYCTRVISSLSYLKLQLIADAICAAIVVLLSALSIIPIPLASFIDKPTLTNGLMAGACFFLAELFVSMSLNEGPTGPVSAIISFNAIIVSVMTWAITGIALKPVQILGVLIAIAGILTVSLSKQPAPRVPKVSPKAAIEMQ